MVHSRRDVSPKINIVSAQYHCLNELLFWKRSTFFKRLRTNVRIFVYAFLFYTR